MVDPKPFKVVGWFLLMILAVLAALHLDATLFPFQKSVTPQPRDLTITIDDKGQGAQATELTASRLHGDNVRWENHTNKSFELHFTDDPATSDDDSCPFKDGCITIVVSPNVPTGWFRIANRPAEKGKIIRFKYRSTTTPLSGPPGEPGMTVEE